MGNSCFKGEESDGENNYLAGGSSGVSLYDYLI